MSRSLKMLVAAAPLAAAAGGFLLLASCGEDAPPAPEKPADNSGYAVKTPFRPEEAGAKEPPAVAFADVTKESGVDFVHVTGATGKKYLPETMGAGVAMLDYDGDGLQDLFLVQGAHWPDARQDPAPTCKLYRNLGGLRFEDVSAATGTDLALTGMGVSAADYDGDGDPDLLITALEGIRLLRNDPGLNGGRRTFADVTAQAGLATPTWTDSQGRAHPIWTTSSAWLDYDCDGVLDLFVCGYVRWSIENDVFDTLDGSSKAYTIPTKYEADSCRLWRGKADGTFEDVTAATGIARSDSKALGVAVCEINGDGRPDLAVSNDTQPNYLFVSQPDGTFAEIANDAGVAFDEVGRARAGMGIDAADLCNDGRLCISIGNFSKEPLSLFVQRPGEKAVFHDRAGAARLSTPTSLSLTFAVVFCDYDLDGCQDILVCNGHIEPEIERVARDVTYEQPTQLFWNRGDGTFADVSAKCGEALARRLVARGAAVGDLDGDGDLDAVITQNGRAALVLRNDQALGHSWVRIRARGAGRNKDALGAQIRVTAGGRTLRRDVRTGSSYLSQCDVAPTFGLGKGAGGPVAAEVRWPSGKVERFEALAAGKEHVVVEGSGVAVK